MSFVSLEDDSSVDSEDFCYWNSASISRETTKSNSTLASDIPSIEDVREDSPPFKILRENSNSD